MGGFLLFLNFILVIILCNIASGVIMNLRKIFGTKDPERKGTNTAIAVLSAGASVGSFAKGQNLVGVIFAATALLRGAKLLWGVEPKNSDRDHISSDPS